MTAFGSALDLLWKKTQRRETTIALAQETVDAVKSMPVEILLASAFEIATGLKRTVYDSLYLALAVSQKAALVTADRKLHSAVAASPLAAHVLWVEDEI